MFLQQQIISRSDMVVLISLNTPGTVFQVKIKLSKFGKNLLIDWHSMVSNHNSTIQWNVSNLFAPRMSIYLFQTVSLCWINIQNFLQQIFKLTCYKIWENVLARQNFFVQLRSVTVFKRQVSANHGKKYDSTAPNIDLQTMILFACYHLRSCVTGRPTCSLKHLIFFVGITQSKIYNFQGILPINQQIFRFQIPMHNIEAMEIGNTTDNLLEIPASLLLINFSIFDNVIKKLSILYILHNQKQMPARLNNFVKLNNGRMANKLQYVNFPGDSLHIRHIDNFLFNQNFYRHSFAGQGVSSQFYFTECALTYCLANQVIPNLFLFVCLALVHLFQLLYLYLQLLLLFFARLIHSKLYFQFVGFTIFYIFIIYILTID